MVSSIIIWPLLVSVAYARMEPMPLYNRQLIQRGRGALEARGDIKGSASAVWNHNVEMLTDIQIANKTFKVVLDTGSADMWLFCTDGADHMEHGREAYNPSTGKKMKADGKDAAFNIKYGKGYAKGHVYTDKVTLAGMTVDQAIGCATSVSKEDVDDREMDGIIGIGFNSGSKTLVDGLAQYPSATKSAMNSITSKGGGFLGLFKTDQPNAQKTFTENAFPQMKEGLFTADIKKNENSNYNFGYVDQDRFSTPLTYMPVRSWNQWIVEISGYTIGAGNSNDGTKKALIDTGTTNIMMPQDMAKKYFSAVPKSKTTDSKNWLVPCNASDAALPDLTITFSPPAPDKDAAIMLPAGKGGVKQEKYNAVVPGSLLIGNLSGKNDGMCQAGITGSDKSNGWDLILGDVFMMSQLIVFDIGDANGSRNKNFPERGQVGFAPKPK
ncbi:aspartic peptidase domain-containing protein [Bisporella sp. PMI_857]|nr:aspartic peptidase domain-containing protein [Bisporella sp. PMI_857]